MSRRIAVVGGGLAGLNAARYLTKRGFEAIVFEVSDRVGGRVTSDVVDGFICDRGFQVINPAYAELKEAGILSKLNIRSLPKGLEINLGSTFLRIGDPRTSLTYLPSLFSKESGNLKDKISFLRYLIGRSEDVDFGSAIEASGTLYRNVLKPFLDGVVLGDSEEISNRVVRELIHWFIKGKPGLAYGGARKFSEELAHGLNIKCGDRVTKVSSHQIEIGGRYEDFDAVILATDPQSAAALLGIESVPMNSCTTWYHRAPLGVINERYLRVAPGSPILNSVVLSNTAPEYAPQGWSLIATTTLSSISEKELLTELERIWNRNLGEIDLIQRYEIRDALPKKSAGSNLVDDLRTEVGIYVAGDWRSIPAQQGALLSGRLAAMAVIADLSTR